jgi:hypothetical protein
MAIAKIPPPPRQTANPAPVRPARSVRRTSTIDVSWPEGEQGDRLFIGRVRDHRTGAAGGPGETLEQAEFRARLAQDRTITAIAATPSFPGLERLVGVRGGNHLRLFIKETMPELIATGAPVYLALDDISGTALVSAFAWSQWHDDWAARIRETMKPEDFERMMSDRINVCWGLQEGNSGVTGAMGERNVADADAGDVRNPADPQGWHELPESDGPGFRRARRIDVTRDDAGNGGAGVIRIAAAFQDSAKQMADADGGRGGRVAIHEYDLVVTADPATLEILTLEPTARILPFSECPGAIHNTRRLVGSRIGDVRQSVLAQLRGPDGCTHLNDALRALAEVPKLAQYLDALQEA